MDSKNSIERIREFIKNQAVSERKFFLECGLPEGAFNKVKSIGSENLKKIALRYTELNLDWVITGRGEMIISPVSTMLVGNSGEGAQLAVQVLKDEIVELQRKLIICHEQKDNLVTGYLPLNKKEPSLIEEK